MGYKSSGHFASENVYNASVGYVYQCIQLCKLEHKYKRLHSYLRTINLQNKKIPELCW